MKGTPATLYILCGCQVRYSGTESMYVTASKDGSLRIWDGVSAECVRPIIGAHGSVEATSAIFTKDERLASAGMCKMLLGKKDM